MITDSFDRTSPDVVVHEQRALAVFINGSGSIVVKQEAAWPDEADDRYVLIRPENAEAVAQAILRVAAEAFGEAEEPSVTGVTRNAAAVTGGRNASRQKRYRERQRNGADGVTHNASDRNGVTDTVTQTDPLMARAG